MSYSNEVIDALRERRERAFRKFEVRSQEVLTADRIDRHDEADLRELRGIVEQLDARLDEEVALEKRRAELEDARREIRSVTSTVDARVTREPRTYSLEGRNSYYADLCISSTPGHPGAGMASERLMRHTHEAAREVVLGTVEGRKVERQVRELLRTPDSALHMQRVEEFRSVGRAEYRAGATTSTMQVTPAYLQDWAPYRQAGRTFANLLNKQPMPEYGMTIYLPKVESASAVAVQGTENTGVTETDPTAGFLSSAVSTPAGQVTISQQWIDRVGYGPGFDKQVSDSLARAYNPAIDVIALDAALANAGAITYTDSSFTVVKAGGGSPSFYASVANASQTIRTAAGTFANPTALVVTPFRWAAMCEAADSTGRPLIVPASVAFNPAAAGEFKQDDAGIEGAVGYNLLGLEVYQDFSIPAPSTGHDQAIVLDPDLVYWYEADPTDRTLPQTLGDQLSVIIQRFTYTACIPVYPLAVQAISGSGMTSTI